jgi:hypothetical protein
MHCQIRTAIRLVVICAMCQVCLTFAQSGPTFTNAFSYEGRYKVGLPEVALKCAETVGISWEKSGAGECAGMDGSGKGEEGVRLLRQSVQNSEKLGITYVSTNKRSIERPSFLCPQEKLYHCH